MLHRPFTHPTNHIQPRAITLNATYQLYPPLVIKTLGRHTLTPTHTHTHLHNKTSPTCATLPALPSTPTQQILEPLCHNANKLQQIWRLHPSCSEEGGGEKLKPSLGILWTDSVAATSTTTTANEVTNAIMH